MKNQLDLNLANIISLLQGEVTAINVAVKALIETHPHPEQLKQKLEDFQQQYHQTASEVQTPDYQRFRCEQVLEEFSNLISK